MNDPATIPALLRYDETLLQQMEVLDALGFVRDKIVLAKLSSDPRAKQGVHLPNVEVVWTNRKAERQVTFRVYLGWAIFCDLRNTEPKQNRYSNHDFSFLDYLAHVKPEQRWAAWRCSYLVDDGFEAFAALVANEFATTLRPVLLGENWLDVPFDWQRQK